MDGDCNHNNVQWYNCTLTFTPQRSGTICVYTSEEKELRVPAGKLQTDAIVAKFLQILGIPPPVVSPVATRWVRNMAASGDAL